MPGFSSNMRVSVNGLLQVYALNSTIVRLGALRGVVCMCVILCVANPLNSASQSHSSRMSVGKMSEIVPPGFSIFFACEKNEAGGRLSLWRARVRCLLSHLRLFAK